MTANKKLSILFGAAAVSLTGLTVLFSTSDYTPYIVQGSLALSSILSAGASAFLWRKRHEGSPAP